MLEADVRGTHVELTIIEFREVRAGIDCVFDLRMGFGEFPRQRDHRFRDIDPRYLIGAFGPGQAESTCPAAEIEHMPEAIRSAGVAPEQVVHAADVGLAGGEKLFGLPAAAALVGAAEDSP